MSEVYDDTPCELGEGILWHPLRKSLFWFDIQGFKLFERKEDDQNARIWTFDHHVSAAGWISEDRLLIASAQGLWDFDLSSGSRSLIRPVEAEDETTRSNDGRADDQGGFWFGTMGKRLEPGRGAIYRYYKGELRKLFAPISIPNSICFSPEGSYAYFADTPKQIVNRVALDAEGWPVGEPEEFIDLRGDKLNPDGSVVDERGLLWNAQWGASRVACYDAAGNFVEAIAFPPTQVSCPAFGGKDLDLLFATSARETLTPAAADAELAGQTFVHKVAARGLPEPRVLLEAS